MTPLPDPRVCPSPEILGEFIEGRLENEVREVVAAHVASCAECVVIAGETVRYLAESATDEIRPPHRRWRALVAAVAAGAVLFVASYFTVTRDPLTRLRRVARSVPERIVEGRLERFPYGSYSLGRSALPESRSSMLHIEARRIIALPGVHARNWHARAIAALVLQRNRDAVRMMETAVRLAPGEVGYWNDLAAARMAGGASARRPEVFAALAAADRAIVLDPSSAAAQFNRGLACEYLDRRAEAVAAYRRSLELEPRARWNQEIRQRIAILRP